MHEALLLVDEGGRVRGASPALCGMLGLPEGELLGRPLADLLAAGEDLAAEACRAAARGAPSEAIAVTLRARGAELAATLSAAPLHLPGGERLAACRVAEAATHRAFHPAEQQDLPTLRATLEASADAVLVIDERMQVVTCNHKFEELWGLPPGWAAMPEYANLLEALKGRVRDPEAFALRVQQIYREQLDTQFELFEMQDGRIVERFSTAYRVGGRVAGRVWSYRDRTELERAQAEVRALKSVAEALSSAVTPQGALDDGLAAVVALFGAQAGWLRVREESGQSRIAARCAPGATEAAPAPPDPELCACVRALAGGQMPDADPRDCEHLARARSAGYTSPYQVCIPVRVGGATVGTLILLAPARRAYAESDERLFQAISDHFGLALERARLFAAERAQRATAETLYDVTSALNATIALPTVLQTVVRLAAGVVRGAGGFLALLEPDGETLAVAHSYNFDPRTLRGGLPRGSGLSWRVMESGEPTLADDYPAHPDSLGAVAAMGVRSAVIVPVVAGRQRLGVLSIFRFAPGEGFTRADKMLLESVGRQAGVAIQNARLYEEVQSMAVRDPLTGLFNQRYLYTAGEQELARAVRYHHPLTALLLDIDHFKRVNDTYGHDVGNVVLRAVAHQCRAQLRASDIVVRYGGEEFVVLLAETPLDSALSVAGRLCARIAQAPVETERGPVSITVSIGVAALDTADGPSGLGALVQAADEALYQAKRGGRNRVCAARP